MSKKIENEHLAAILTYLLVGVIWFFADNKMKKSNLVKFHTKQAINLWVISVVGHAALTMILFIGWSLIPIWSLFMLIFWLLGLISAINGKQTKIPIIGQFAKKYLTF